MFQKGLRDQKGIHKWGVGKNPGAGKKAKDAEVKVLEKLPMYRLQYFAHKRTTSYLGVFPLLFSLQMLPLLADV